MFYHVFMPATLPFVSWAGQKEIVDALCVEPLDSKALKACSRIPSKHTLAYVGPVSGSRFEEDLLREVGVTDLEALSRRLVATYLHVWVVEWFHSGVSERGDQPQSRDLNKAPGVLKALRAFSPRMACRLRVLPKGHVRFVLKVGYPEEPYARAGLFETRFQDPRSQAWDEAARLLCGLMVSDWAHRLCWCPHCEAFFVKEKLRNAPYIHGTFCCLTHQRLASAADCTRDRREAIRDSLLGQAARLLAGRGDAGASWQSDNKLKATIVKHLNALMARDPNLCGHAHEVKVNWVTRHRAAIEQMRLKLAAQSRRIAGKR